ncbi:site-specific tyrosine recombinase XerD [Litorivicinus lipolyticus]|uniref:site-specific tyrosine recombinase XerD n=1 Tax=Litorivicinus lipolyticus TaxID=418701 RepID=UPI003B5ADB1A
MTDTDRVAAYLDSLWLERGLSENSLAAYRRDLTAWVGWLNSRQLTLAVFCVSDLSAYLADRQVTGLSTRSLARVLSSVRGLCQYLVRIGLRSDDPSRDVPAPRMPRTLPSTLSEADVDALLATPDVSTVHGLRDKVALEILYAAGLRVSELTALRLPMIDRQAGVVRVTGKGSKERLVPLGEECVFWIGRYLEQARALLPAAGDSDYLLPGRKGAWTRQALWYRIKAVALAAGVNPGLSPHGLRHAFATHLLNHGVDLRSVQMMLGHADLSTTQIYTQVATARLQALHDAHHPRND